MSTEVASTLKPVEVAVSMVELAVYKHKTRADKVFIKAVCMLVFYPTYS